MEKGYYKEIENIIDYKNINIEHKDEQGALLYTEHLVEPIIEKSTIWVEKTEEELNTEELDNLRSWFFGEYTKQEQKFRRLRTLNFVCDDGSDPYDALIALYQDAEIKRNRIQELEFLIQKKENEKGGNVDA